MPDNAGVAQAWLDRLQRERPECFHEPAFFPAKLSEEAGEAVKEANKRLGFHRDSWDIWHEAEELADVVICAYGQAIMAGIDLDNAIAHKHRKLQERAMRS